MSNSSSNIVYLLSSDNDGNQSIVVFDEKNSPHIVSGDHSSFDEILSKVQAGDTSVFSQLEPGKAIAEAILSDRVEYKDNALFFDGEQINGGLVDHIIKLVNEQGSDASVPYVKFLENLDRNPSAHSRSQLFRFLEKNEFTINQNGNIVGYKGVHRLGFDVHSCIGYCSVHSGPAVINGEEHLEGPVPQNIDDIVEIKRTQVMDDPTVACSTGLHVAAWSYAKSFGGSCVLAVEVDPADVVSVPKDASDQKIRVCRYVVLDEVTEPYDQAFVETEGEKEKHLTPLEWSSLKTAYINESEGLDWYTFDMFVFDEYDLGEVDFDPNNQDGNGDWENTYNRLNWVKYLGV